MIQNMSSLGKLRGTYAYCAPEIYFGEPFTAKSDIYSMGIVFWEIFNRYEEYFVAENTYKCRLLRKEYDLPFSNHEELVMEFQVIIAVAQKGTRFL